MAREGGWAGLLGLAGAACRYVNSLILTRVLGSSAYGLFALANTVITLLQLPANMGLPMSAVHFVAGSAGTKRWANLRWIIRAALRLVVVSSIVWAVLIVVTAPWTSGALFRKEGLFLPLAGLAAALPLLGIGAVCSGSLQGLKLIRAKVFFERIAHPLVFSVLLVAGGLFFRSLGYVLVCFGIATAVVAFACGGWLSRSLRQVPPAEGPVTLGWRELLRFSTPVMFLNLLNYFILWSDVLIMGIFRPAAEVGVYHIASRLGVAVNMPTEALNSSLAPNYSSLHSQGDMAGLNRTFHTSTRWILALSSLICLVLVFGGRPLLRVFGPDFTAGYLALCLLAGGQLASAAMGTNGMLLTMTGYPHVNLVNAVILGLANLGLNLVLVPRYGAAGAAAAAASSLALVNVVRCAEIWVIFRTVPWDRTVLKPLGALLVAGAAGGAALLAAGPLPAAAVAPAVFVLVWWLAGPEAEDLDLLRRARARLSRG
ncbi:MAG: oligosaccharide flippase family protein [Acidobacteria bacterium]|nr:oligosaccharide flippase family protein [Acidobacteriota bacterium]